MQKLVWQNTLGDVIDLTSGNYGITNWEGFANTSLNIQSQQVPFQDGGVFLDALMEQRELSVTLAMNDNNDLEKRYRMRRELVHILNPKLGEGYLIYTNDFISKRIKCVPQIPLFETHNSNDSGTPKASLSWTACEPYWEDLEDTSIIVDAEEINVIKNEGDIPCQLNIDLYNIESENVEIKNLTSGKDIKLNGTHNGIININTGIGTKKVETKEIKADTFMIERMIKYACYDSLRNDYVLAGTYAIIKTKDFKTFEVYTNSYDISVIYFIPETNKFIASGIGFTIYSPDGIHWTSVINYATRNIMYVNNKYYAFATSGSDTTVYQSTDGLTWTSSTVEGIKLKDITYAEELNLFIGVADRAIYTSADSEEWTLKQSYSSAYTLQKVCYLKNVNIVVVADYVSSQENYLRCIYSLDGETWQESITSNIKVNAGYSVISGIRSRGFYIINRRKVINSITGQSWEVVETKDVDYTKILHFDTLGDFLIFSMYTTETLITKQVRIEDIGTIKDIAYSEKLKRYVLISSNKIYVSNDKVIWTQVAQYSDLWQLIYIDDWGKFIIFSSAQTRKYYTSTDGIEWSVYDNTKVWNPIQAKYIPELKKLFVVGASATNSGKIAITSDLTEWEVRNRAKPIYSIVYSTDKQRLIVTAQDSVTYYSDDGGNSWEQGAANIYSSVSIDSKLVYSENMKKVFLPFFSTTDSLVWLMLNTLEIEEICYSEEFVFFIGFKNTNCYISYNCQEWQLLDLGLKSPVDFEKIKYIEADKTFYLIGRIPDMENVYTFVELKVQNGENMISDIDGNSDMTLGLEAGENEIKIKCPEGFIMAKISYRQKYIGV